MCRCIFQEQPRDHERDDCYILLVFRMNKHHSSNEEGNIILPAACWRALVKDMLEWFGFWMVQKPSIRCSYLYL